jgi:protein-L-isoaspartate(D-aspartate) O-methyltransferase
MSDSAGRKPRSGSARRWPLSLDRIGLPAAAPGGRTMSTADAQTLRPQRPLSDALREANRLRAAPVAHSDLQAFRQHMVQRLRLAGCQDERVLAAMNAVPRHLFVDSALVVQAYEDTSLPIGLGQTISKPSVVARMIELLRHRPGGADLARVLEIGTGCGYQAAVLAHVAGRVVTIERLRGLHDRALRQLAPLQLPGIELVYGDGRLGHGLAAPYDGIIAAAGGHDLPAAWLDQLARGGRLVAPVHDPVLGSQVLMVVDKLGDGRIVQRIHEAVRFVPLESGTSDFGRS